MGQTADEALCGGRPLASDLHGQHHETSPCSASDKFRVLLCPGDLCPAFRSVVVAAFAFEDCDPEMGGDGFLMQKGKAWLPRKGVG